MDTLKILHTLKLKVLGTHLYNSTAKKQTNSAAPATAFFMVLILCVCPGERKLWQRVNQSSVLVKSMGAAMTKADGV